MAEAVEARQHEAKELVAHKEHGDKPPIVEQLPSNDQDDPKVGESMGHFPDLCPRVEGDHSILSDIKLRYEKDPLCTKVLASVEQH